MKDFETEELNSFLVAPIDFPPSLHFKVNIVIKRLRSIKIV